MNIARKHTILLGAAAAGVPIALLAGVLCIRPYDVPEYRDIDTSESAFLIPLEGETSAQAAFQSVKFLDERKIAAKRVQIPHRWNQTGFLPRTGEWMATMRLVKVDRRPITREWTQSPKTGTSTRDEAIAAESLDSVNFSIGLSCTAHIPEEMVATFLYSYPSKSLAEMLDSEVRARVHQVIAEEAGKYPVFDLPARKNDIVKAVREDVLPFFRKKGIEITTLAMLGGLKFDNAEIQRAIDDAAKAAQLKVAAEAKRASQEVENKTMLLAAEGKAQAAMREAESKSATELIRAEGEAKVKTAEAKAEAEIRKLSAQAEAAALRLVSEARADELKKAGDQAEVYLRLKSLEMEMQRWKQWDGRFPSTWFGPGMGTAPSLNLLMPVTQAQAAKQ